LGAVLTRYDPSAGACYVSEIREEVVVDHFGVLGHGSEDYGDEFLIQGEDEGGGVGDGSVGKDGAAEKGLEGAFEGVEVAAVHGVLFANGCRWIGGRGGVGAVEGCAAVELEDSVHEEVPAALSGVEVCEVGWDIEVPDFVDVPV